MSHLRMLATTIIDRAQNASRSSYLFTQSQWHAISHVAGNSDPTKQTSTVMEGDYVDPNSVFPYETMRGVDYAISRGCVAHVTEYVFAGIYVQDHELGQMPMKAGVIMELRDGADALLGLYAMRYPTRGR